MFVVYHSVANVPNAFTPNGDGMNDIFRIANLNYETLLEFKVFNRYGALIFETQDPQHGWDGTYNSQLCDIGVYYYVISVVMPDGASKVFKGDVTLIR